MAAYKVAWASIGSAVALVCWLTVGLVWPPRLYSRFDLLQVDSSVARGEVAHAHLTLCKDTAAFSQVSVSLQNHVFYPLPITIANFPVGCHEIPFGVRADVPPGQYRIVIGSMAESSPFRREFYRAEVPLEVLP